MILHVLKKTKWDRFSQTEKYEHPSLHTEGFIHFSTPSNLHLVTPNFKDIQDDLVILCVDESLLIHEVKYESTPGSSEKFPHLYGYLNTNAIISVLPYNKDQNGLWIKNPEIHSLESSK